MDSDSKSDTLGPTRSGSKDGKRHGRFGAALEGRRNSLNFLRVVFALMVLLSHAAGLGGFSRWQGDINGTSLAQLGLYGFFAISGYLITQSVVLSSTRRYLFKRVLRIFPGLIACLLVTAYGISLFGWYASGKHSCGLHCYFAAPDGPFTYVIKNALLSNPFWYQHTIAGLPTSFLENWNSSIWTLFYEFCCYLIALGLCLVGLFRNKYLSLVAFLGLWFVIGSCTLIPSLSQHFNFFELSWEESLLRFAGIFFAGSIVYLFRNSIPDSGWLALALICCVTIGVLLPTGGRIPTIQFTPIDMFLPLIVYPVLWLGSHLPFRQIGSKNDYSYGLYIYAWPITELFLIMHLERHGVFVFVGASLLGTIPFALASWWLIEKRSLAWKPGWLIGSQKEVSHQP
jgi:peptidoglycan/LPS O-acetylase OafA/YrhL